MATPHLPQPGDDASRWPFGELRETVRFDEVPSFPTDDVMTDLRMLLDRVRATGLKRVIVVNLSIPDLPVHVVRVIVPGMEIYAFDQGKLGPGAGVVWDRTLRELISRRQEVTVQ
jgi:ribosomal protein S12 methylthiotransferase accessory factor